MSDEIKEVGEAEIGAIEDITEIEAISSETADKIRRKTAVNLPNNPTAAGMSAAEIKKAFYRHILDTQDSVIAEINRIVEKSNYINAIVKQNLQLHYGTEELDTEAKTALGAINELNEKKLDKITEQSALPRAYVKAADGSQTSIGLNSSAGAGHIVWRNNKGQSFVKAPDGTDGDGIVNVEYLEKVAPILGENGFIPSNYLPSYVDDVIEVETKTALPALGESGKIYVDVSTGDTYRWGGSAYARITGGIPLEDGISPNSIQQEGCVAGLKGFYWSAIDVDNRVITLSAKNGDFGTEQEFNISDFWAVGDVISISTNKKWTNCATITAISGKTITVDGFFDEFEVGYSSKHITDQAVCVVEKPDKGLCDFGQYAVSFGENNRVTAYGGFSAGRDNQITGQYGAALGRDHIVDYADLAAGRNIELYGWYNAGFGRNHEIHANDGFVSGNSNVIFKGAHGSGAIGLKNRVFSENSFTAGTECVTGIKGFYWSNIDLSTKTITLSTKNDSYGTEQSFDISNYWATGDYVTIHSDKKWENCSKISNVSGDTITVESFPNGFTVLKESGHFTDQAVFVSAKPDKGLVDFGTNSVSFGDNCKAPNYGVAAFGRENNAYGQYAFAAGRNNQVGYGGAAFGRGNKVFGVQGFAVGYNNTVNGGGQGVALGLTNTVTNSSAQAFGDYCVTNGKFATSRGHLSSAGGEASLASGTYASSPYKDSHALGQNVTTGCEAQTVVGKYNAVSENELFTVGNGEKKEDGAVIRRNVFAVTSKDSLILSRQYNNTESACTGYGSAAIGRGVTVTSNGSLGCGTLNAVSSPDSVVGGFGNTSTATCNAIFGAANSSEKPHCFLAGNGHTSTRGCQTLVGNYSNPSENTLFAVGDGTSDTDRSNAFEVLSDASGVAIKVGGLTLTEAELKVFAGHEGSLLDTIYPIGSIYMTAEDKKPAELFGGEWEQLQGRFLLGADDTYSLGDTGGETTHKLTVSEMPKHAHAVYFDHERYLGESAGGADPDSSCYPTGGMTDGGRNGTLLLSDNGGSEDHNNMPPYLVVKMWKRIA